jgi:hypothetical protein
MKTQTLGRSHAVSAAAPRAGAPQDFRWSVSLDFGMGSPEQVFPLHKLPKVIARLKELGVQAVRFELAQKDTQDIATNPQNRALQIVRAVRAAGIDVTAVVGLGGNNALEPGFNADDPKYIEKISQNVRDIARTLGPLGVKHFQVENEINCAGLATLPVYNWRSGRRWWSDDFKVEVVKALSEAVRGEIADAVIYTNLHDGVTDPNGSVDEMLQRFAPHIDQIGLDYYSNQIVPYAVSEQMPKWLSQLTRGGLGTADLAEALKERVEHYQALTGKPVWISETGYPTDHSFFPHTAAGQFRFAQEMADAARQSGAAGFNYFRLMDRDGTPPGGLAKLAPNHGIEPYFGLLDAELNPKWGTMTEWTWAQHGPLSLPKRVETRVSAWEALKAAIAEDRFDDA